MDDGEDDVVVVPPGDFANLVSYAARPPRWAERVRCCLPLTGSPTVVDDLRWVHYVLVLRGLIASKLFIAQKVSFTVS